MNEGITVPAKRQSAMLETKKIPNRAFLFSVRGFKVVSKRCEIYFTRKGTAKSKVATVASRIRLCKNP